MDGVIPLPSPPSLEQAVRRYWELRRLDREGVIAPGALALPLRILADDHPRLAPLVRHPGAATAAHPCSESDSERTPA